MSFLKSPVLSPLERNFNEEFNNSLQKNTTTNESYSMTDKGTLAFTTSNKKFKTSFEDVNSNGKFELTHGTIIEFEEFNALNKETNNVTGNFGKHFEEIRKNNELSMNSLKEMERKNENLRAENEDLKRILGSKEKDLENLKENINFIEKSRMSSSQINKIEKKNEELLKEILSLKQKLIEMNQTCKDSDIENIKLKEEIENRVEIFAYIAKTVHREKKCNCLLTKSKILKENYTEKNKNLKILIKIKFLMRKSN